MMLLCILSSLAGFTGLCLGMSRHQRDLLGKALPAPTTRAAKTAGWCFLAAAWAAAVADAGAALGSVYWIGALTFAALVVALSVTRLSR